MKKILVLLLTFCCIATLTSCGGDSKKDLKEVSYELSEKTDLGDYIEASKKTVVLKYDNDNIVQEVIMTDATTIESYSRDDFLSNGRMEDWSEEDREEHISFLLSQFEKYADDAYKSLKSECKRKEGDFFHGATCELEEDSRKTITTYTMDIEKFREADKEGLSDEKAGIEFGSWNGTILSVKADKTVDDYITEFEKIGYVKK